MFEGKHIHFSPENKPLCSYSNKLCRQRRLNGFAFCIRHILEDSSAPFKQCSYMVNSKTESRTLQQCLNAIPSSQERGFCTIHMQTHLQETGVLPKPEKKSKGVPLNGKKVVLNGELNGKLIKTRANPKKKPFRPETPSENSSSSSSSTQFSSSNNLDSTIHNVSQNISSPSPPPISTTSSSPLLLNGRLSPLVVNTNGKIRANGTCYNGKKTQIDHSMSNGKSYSKGSPFLNELNGGINGKKPNLYLQVEPITLNKSKLTNPIPKCKPKLGSTLSTRPILFTSISTPPIKPCTTLPESLKGLGAFREDLKASSSIGEANKIKFQQWRTLKTLEKAPLTDFSGKKPIKKEIEEKPTNSCKVSSFELLMVPPLLNARTKTDEFLYQNDSGEPESRSEFLARVRKAFKSQLRAVESVSKYGEKEEKVSTRAFRESLLYCVINDPGFTSNVLKTDPKYKLEVKESPSTKESPIASLPLTLDGDSPIYDSEERNPSGNPNVIRLNAFIETMDSNEYGNQTANNTKKVPRKSSGEAGRTNGMGYTIGNPTKSKSQATKLKGNNSGKNRGLILNGNHVPNGLNGSTDILEATNFTKINGRNKKSPPGSNEPLENGLLKKPRIENGGLDLDFMLDTPPNGSTNGLSLNGQLNAHSQGTLNNLISSVIAPSYTTSNSSNSLPPFHSLNNYTTELPSLTSVTSESSLSSDIITDPSFDSPFDSHSQQDAVDFTDEDLEKFKLHIDPEIAHQASRLLENGLTEDDFNFNDLFPHDKEDGLDLCGIENGEIDYSLFANMLNYRETMSGESISVTNQF